MGVWIETGYYGNLDSKAAVTPRVGVWIETKRDTETSHHTAVTPRVGVWIETWVVCHFGMRPPSLPAWECGLKHNKYNGHCAYCGSLPAWECGLKPFGMSLSIS